MKTFDWVSDLLKKATEHKKITIALGDETYEAFITELPARGKLPKRFEIEVPKGISTGETDQFGDNPTYAWTFPCDNEKDAIKIFVDKIEKLRKEHNYYLAEG